MTILWNLSQPFVGYIAMGLTALLALWGKGKLDQRKGRKAEQAKQAEARAKANTETVKKVLHETASDDPAADIRRRLRERAGRP